MADLDEAGRQDMKQESPNELDGAYPLTIGRRGTVEISTTSVTFSALGLRFSPAGPITSFHTLSAAAWR